MANISVAATRSITVSSKFPNKSFQKQTITIGCRKGNTCYSYVFFDTGVVACDHVQSATLVLFKASDFFIADGITYYIMPVVSPFSSRTTYTSCTPNDFDLRLAVEFCPPGREEVAVQIDVTTIVNRWLVNTLPNCGLVIAGYGARPGESGCISLGSAYSRDNTLIPVINMSYQQNVFCWLPPPPNLRYEVTALEKQK